MKSKKFEINEIFKLRSIKLISKRIKRLYLHKNGANLNRGFNY